MTTTERTLPLVAVIGRPNVGKSTLVNRIVGERVAIVEDRPGVTRDRKEVEAEWLGVPFLLVDTRGIGLEPMTSDSRRSHRVSHLAAPRRARWALPQRQGPSRVSR